MSNPDSPRTPDNHLPPESGRAPQSLPLRTIVTSILAAGFGVQSGRTRERDFTQGKSRHYVIGGIVFTVVFVLTVITVVRIVLRQAGT